LFDGNHSKWEYRLDAQGPINLTVYGNSLAECTHYFKVYYITQSISHDLSYKINTSPWNYSEEVRKHIAEYNFLGEPPVSPTPSYEESEPIKCDKDPFTTFSPSADQDSPRQSEAKPSYAKQDYSADKKERARANSENPFAGTDATDGETSRPAVTPGDLATDGSYELGVWSYHYNNNRY